MKTFLNIAIGVLVGLAMTGVILVATRAPSGESVELRPAPTPEPLRVHVAGAVVRPGVYEFEKNSRVEDAVDATQRLAHRPPVEHVAGTLVTECSVVLSIAASSAARRWSHSVGAFTTSQERSFSPASS